MKKLLLIPLTALALQLSATVRTLEIDPADGGELRRAVAEAIAEKTPQDTLVIKLLGDSYEFHPSTAASRELYISNHDQTNPKSVGLIIENARNVVLDGDGAELLFHGRMLPVALLNSSGCTLRDFAIDFPNPHISQVEIIANDTLAGLITYRPAPWVDWEIRDSILVVKGEGWEHTPKFAIAFEEGTRRVAYRTGDINVGVTGLTANSRGDIEAPWRDSRLKPGMRLAMRSYGRPAPALFLDNDTATILQGVTVHYAEGMGLLAQNCVDITLDSCAVALRGPSDPRYFTTQADATHFSSCSGLIDSTRGIYENMMDDAINVHGTYLKVTEIVDSATLRGRYMHDQSWGFAWGAPGDSVRFISASTMEPLPSLFTIKSITPATVARREPSVTETPSAPREFLITLDGPSLPETENINEQPLGLENLSRTPEVHFANNIVRNNRARGALFSSPRRTICEDNTFDHTSGAAILLCGDCNGWFESGACRDITIRRNNFINALTTPYQFTEAVISIFPVIPDLEHQRTPFHSNVTITDNRFVTFGTPLLYAKSTAGLRFLRNTLETNSDYPNTTPPLPSP